MSQYPQPQIARAAGTQGARSSLITTIGVLNIIMGLLCGTSAAGLASQPAMMEMQARSLQETRRQVNEQLDRELEELKKQRSQATDPEQSRRAEAAIRAAELSRMPDMSGLFRRMAPPRVARIWTWGGTAGAIIGMLMLASGIGLLMAARWGWILGIWASVLKLIEAVVMTALNILVVAPEMGGAMRGFVTDLQNSVPAAPNAPPVPVDVGGMTQAWMQGLVGAQTVVMTVFGVAWPIAALFLLTSRPVRAAFGRRR